VSGTEEVLIQADGIGYGYKDMLCYEEYGSESINDSVDTIKKILENATVGINDQYVEHIFKGVVSGHDYTPQCETIDGSIRYLFAPFKPCNKFLDDVCDLVTAIKAGGAGPHWTIDPNGNVCVATIGNHGVPAVTYWPTWLGGETNATLTQGIDFTGFNFEKLEKEANYVLYVGHWQRPVHDDWTEDGFARSLWTAVSGGGAGITLSDDTTITADPTTNHVIVGLNSLQAHGEAAANPHYYYYPSAGTIGIKMSTFGSDRYPGEINFYMREDNNATPQMVEVRISKTVNTDYWYYNLKPLVDFGLTGSFVHITLPLGTKWPKERYPNFRGWTGVGAPDWEAINYIEFAIQPGAGAGATIDVYLDDLYLSGLVMRVAKEAGIDATNKCRMLVIRDDVAQDDTMKSGTPGTTDVGTMARLAYAELLRAKSEPTLGVVTTRFIPSAKAGQLVHIHAKKTSAGTFNIDDDFRITEVVHSVTDQEYTTSLDVTTDVTNSHARTRFGDIRTVLKASRPEFQDRQASSMKIPEIWPGHIILTETY
jgi:hypothetical protein